MPGQRRFPKETGAPTTLHRSNSTWFSSVLLLCIACLLSMTAKSCSAFSSSFVSQRKHRYPGNNAFVHLSLSTDDSAEAAEPLPLTQEDLHRMSDLKSRNLQMPIMILDAMLPLQTLTFQSSDPKFNRLVTYCLEEVPGTEMGMLGMNPHTGQPLSFGVTMKLKEENIKIDTDSVTITVTAERRMEVQGEPWLDESESFYLADIEIVEDREESMSGEQRKEAERLSKTIPDSVKEWVQCVLKAEAADDAGMKSRMADLGAMPDEDDMTERALWTAALINPLPSLGVCLEIRPAMLACGNDYDRMVLVCQALQSSMDHLSGKQRLF
jgi:hypothetical protein